MKILAFLQKTCPVLDRWFVALRGAQKIGQPRSGNQGYVLLESMVAIFLLTSVVGLSMIAMNANMKLQNQVRASLSDLRHLQSQVGMDCWREPTKSRITKNWKSDIAVAALECK
jgi:hypothetical protein